METEYTGCVLLWKAPIDKVAAKVLVERHQKSPIPIVSFWAAPQCSDEQRLEWEENNILAVDLGGDKYHYSRNQVGSATEFMAKHIVGGEGTPAEQRLIDMANKNNKTGYLKGFNMAIAWTMRELYELRDDHIEIIERVGDVVRCWLDFTDGVGLTERTMKEVEEAKLGDLLKNTEKCSNAPFTPGSYLVQMWRLGRSIPYIRERVEYWIHGWKAVKAKQAEAKEEFNRIMAGNIKPHREFSVDKLNGILLRTDNKFLTREAASATKNKKGWPLFDVVVVVNSDGRVSALSRNFDLTRLGEELFRREPGKWFHSDVQPGLLLNGGFMYKDSIPTNLSGDEFLELLRKHRPRLLTGAKTVFVDTGQSLNRPFASVSK